MSKLCNNPSHLEGGGGVLVLLLKCRKPNFEAKTLNTHLQLILCFDSDTRPCTDMALRGVWSLVNDGCAGRSVALS